MSISHLLVRLNNRKPGGTQTAGTSRRTPGKRNKGDSTMTDTVRTFWQDLKYAARSLARTKGLTLTVVLTLALGIGANGAIFALVRGVLLRPLVNRGEERLIYIRPSGHGAGIEGIFSVP